MADQNHAWIEAALADCPSAEFRRRLRDELRRSRLMRVATGQRGVGYHTVMPHIMVRNAEAFVNFAKEVFGAEESFKITNTDEAGNSHYEIRLGDSMLMCGGGGSELPGPEMRVALHVYVEDADQTYQRALDAGAEIIAAPETKPYGERLAGVTDPAGNRWYIATRLPNAMGPPPSRAVAPYLLRENTTGLLEFVKNAFGAQVMMVMPAPGGKVMHAVARIGDSPLEFGDSDGSPSAFVLDVPNVDEVYEQALAAGATSQSVPTTYHWGVRMAGVTDAWGNQWTISTELNK